MPKMKLRFVFGMQAMFTPEGIHLERHTFDAFVSKEMYETIKMQWHERPRPVIEIQATPEELAGHASILSGTTIIDLNECKFMTALEMSEIEIAQSKVLSLHPQ